MEKPTVDTHDETMYRPEKTPRRKVILFLTLFGAGIVLLFVAFAVFTQPVPDKEVPVGSADVYMRSDGTIAECTPMTDDDTDSSAVPDDFENALMPNHPFNESATEGIQMAQLVPVGVGRYFSIEESQVYQILQDYRLEIDGTSVPLRNDTIRVAATPRVNGSGFKAFAATAGPWNLPDRPGVLVLPIWPAPAEAPKGLRQQEYRFELCSGERYAAHLPFPLYEEVDVSVSEPAAEGQVVEFPDLVAGDIATAFHIRPSLAISRITNMSDGQLLLSSENPVTSGTHRFLIRAGAEWYLGVYGARQESF